MFLMHVNFVCGFISPDIYERKKNRKKIDANEINIMREQLLTDESDPNNQGKHTRKEMWKSSRR